MSGIIGQITKTGGTNAITGGTNVPPVIQLKYALPQAHVAVFKRKLRPLCFS